MNEYPSKCHTFALVKRLQVRVKAAARQNSSKLDSALTLHFTCPRVKLLIVVLIINKVKRKRMKRIEAIIRKTKFEDVKEALLQSDIDWFEYHSVHGIGQSREERIYRGVQYSTDVIERVALTIVCRDPLVEPTVKVILKVAHTGEVGDGRIFVSDMIDTWSIRTGENGDTVLRDKK